MSVRALLEGQFQKRTGHNDIGELETLFQRLGARGGQVSGVPSRDLVSVGLSSCVLDDVVDVDAEDAGAVVGEQSGERASNDFAPVKAI